MADWAYGFDRQAFEFWRVDPETWADAEPLRNVVSGGTAVRDLSRQTYSSASLDLAGEIPDESVVRCYMTVAQAGARERVCIDTWMAFRSQRAADAATLVSRAALHGPLMALANREQTLGNKPPVGYTVPAGANCAATAARELGAHGVAPAVAPPSDAVLESAYVAGIQQGWLDVGADLAAAAGMEVTSDPYGRTSLVPAPVPGAVRPAWTFHDGNSAVKSNILAEATDERGTSLVPNVVEVVWNRTAPTVVGRAADDDPAHPTSTAARGYELVRRLVNPAGLQAGLTPSLADALAARELASARVVVRRVTVSHPFCPARAGDVAEVDYSARGIAGVGRIVRQSISLATGAQTTSVIEIPEVV